MSATVSFGQNSGFKIGWTILLIIAALMALGHFSLIFMFAHERIMFAGLGLSNLYALLVIYFLFRQGKKWAWVVTWSLPALAFLIAVSNPTLAIYYYGIAAVCVLGLLLTMGDFFSPARSQAT
jgi:hypothetical protein